MGFIKKVAAKKNFHACLVPSLAGLGKGNVWECGECSDLWTVKTCFGEYETYLDWCRTTSDGKKVPFLSAYRFPTRRQKAPTSHDLNRVHKTTATLEA